MSNRTRTVLSQFVLLIAAAAVAVGLLASSARPAGAEDGMPTVCTAINGDDELSLVSFTNAAPTRICHQIVIKDGKLDPTQTSNNAFTAVVLDTTISFTMGGTTITAPGKVIVATFKGIDLSTCTLTGQPSAGVKIYINKDAKDQVFIYTDTNFTITANCPKDV